MPVFADAGDRRHLWPLVAAFFREPHLIADGKLLPLIEHAVAVEVELPPSGVEIPPLAFGVDVGHAAVLGLDAGLHVLALATCMILELPPRRMECIPDRDVDILVRAVKRMIAADDDVGPRDRKRHAHVNALPLMMVLVRAFDHHVTALNPGIDVLKLDSPFTYEFFDRRTRRHVSECDV